MVLSCFSVRAGAANGVDADADADLGDLGLGRLEGGGLAAADLANADRLERAGRWDDGDDVGWDTSCCCCWWWSFRDSFTLFESDDLVEVRDDEGEVRAAASSACLVWLAGGLSSCTTTSDTGDGLFSLGAVLAEMVVIGAWTDADKEVGV